MDAASLTSRVISLNTILFFMALLIGGFVIRKFITKSNSYSTLQYGLISASISGIFATTLRYWMRIGTPDTFWLINQNLWKSAFALDSNWLLNFALFIPAGTLNTYYGKQPVKTLVELVLLSFLLETIQGFTQWGASDPADWMANTCGAAMGIIIAGVIRKAFISV